MRYVKSKHYANWEEIGLELNLNHAILTDIEADHPFNDRECFYYMIWKWMSIDRNPTWKTLETALTNVNRQNLSLYPVDDVYGMKTHRM